MSRPLPNRLFYHFCRLMSCMVGTVYFRLRSTGSENVPSEGGLLVLSHHQSMLDPIIVGVGTRRMLSFMGRKTLFRNPIFRWVINTGGGFPIDREGQGIKGLKETIRRLEAGEAVLIFPEGTRSVDGEVQPLKAGFTVLARKAKVPIVVVAMDGSSASLPRGAHFPRPIAIHVVFSNVLTPDAIANMSDEELTAEVAGRMHACHDLARDKRLGNPKLLN
jgi:1-acyl-sn-glycerol-3-phosphate acyltransferase